MNASTERRLALKPGIALEFKLLSNIMCIDRTRTLGEGLGPIKPV